jgi:photosystem II stability/assembly factor-like uncharacterized protein
LISRFVNVLAFDGVSVFAGMGNGQDQGGVYILSADGQTWSDAGLQGSRVLALLSSGSALFAGTDGGGVFSSTDWGRTWTPMNSGLTKLDVRSLAASGDTLFAGTLSGGIYRSTNRGQNWKQINTNLPQGLPVFSLSVTREKLYAGTVYGVFVSTDQGDNWRQLNAGLQNIFVTSLAVNGERLIVGTLGGGVFTSQIPE